MANIRIIKPLFDSLEYLNSQEPPSHVAIPDNYRKDYQKACSFLYSYRGSIATFNAYRREIERLLQWSWFVAQRTLIELKREDIENFIEFCQNPPSEWIGSKHVTRFMDSNAARVVNPDWKPFVATVSKKAHRSGKSPDIQAYSLSQKALQAIFSIIGSFYNYLIQEEYVAINPVAQIRQKSKFIRKRQGKTQIRRLSELQWSYVIETAEIMTQQAPEHERTLFIMNALYGMYLRISELASTARWQPQMGHFFKDMDGNWWFRTVGKGNKERDVSVSDAMLAALKRYRLSLNFPAFPSPGEETPLLMRLTGKGSVNGTRHIRKIVQKCFDETVLRLHKDNFSEEAEMLMSATVHWLRHTGISDDVKHRPREHVRDDAGHSSSAITDKYIDVEMRARHASAKKKLIKV